MAIGGAETCWTMVRAAGAGDASALSTFSRCYVPTIQAYLRHRWRAVDLLAEVDDATQDVLVECIKEGGALERADPAHGEFRALLYGVVRNVARRFEEQSARSRERQPESSVFLDALPAQAEALSRFFDRAWADSILKEAILRHAAQARLHGGGIRRRYRILRLRHQRGLPVRDIARLLEERDVDSVHNDYRRARREFRGILRETVAAHTGARGADIDAECRRLTESLGD